MQDLPSLVLARFAQLADLERRVTAERRNVLAGDRGVVHALDRLVTHPADDRDARVAEYRQRVVHVAHDASEFELEDRVESQDDEVPVDLVVSARRGLLLYSERNTRPVPGRGTCGAAPWPRGPETEWPARRNADRSRGADPPSLRSILGSARRPPLPRIWSTGDFPHETDESCPRRPRRRDRE